LGAAWLAAEAHDHAVFHSQPSQREIEGLAAALTEQRNPRSQNLGKKCPLASWFKCLFDEEKFVQGALQNATADLARALKQ
jgi:streptomycin 6-kinase